MKKRDVIILTVGISALVLCLAFKGIAVASAVRTFGATGGWDTVKSWFQDDDGELHVEILDPIIDLEDFVVIGDTDKVKVTNDGITVDDGDDKVNVDKNGVDVRSDDNRVTVGRDGIFIENDEHKIEIGKNGISVK